MPATEAQIRANRANALKSTGPKTAEGKERSRANALKHGQTGDGVVLTNEDAAEVDRTFEELQAELKPAGPMGRTLVRRIATCIVRMDRSVVQETAALNERVLKAESEAEANGEDPVQAGRRALFDPSKEATLARKYEAAAERGMYKALKEFRQLARETKATAAEPEAAPARRVIGPVGSFFPAVELSPPTAKSATLEPAKTPKPAPKPLPAPARTAFPAWNPTFGGSVDVPITIGRAR